MALIEIRPLPVEVPSAIVLRLCTRAIARVAPGVEVFALQRFRPHIKSRDAKPTRQGLLDRDLQAVIVRTLRRLNLGDAGELWIRRGTAWAYPIGHVIVRTTIIHRAGGVGVRTVLCGVGSGAGGSGHPSVSVEHGVVQIPLDRQLA